MRSRTRLFLPSGLSWQPRQVDSRLGGPRSGSRVEGERDAISQLKLSQQGGRVVGLCPLPHLAPQKGGRVSALISWPPPLPPSGATFNLPPTVGKAACSCAFSPELSEPQRGVQLIMECGGPLAKSCWLLLLLLLLPPSHNHQGQALRQITPTQVQEQDRVISPCV